jgi:hypothetical protein
MNSLALGLDRGHTRPNKILIGRPSEMPKLANERLKSRDILSIGLVQNLGQATYAKP